MTDLISTLVWLYVLLGDILVVPETGKRYSVLKVLMTTCETYINSNGGSL